MFQKNGQSQPFTVASEKCQMCGTNAAVVSVDGKMICNQCKEKCECTAATTPAQG